MKALAAALVWLCLASSPVLASTLPRADIGGQDARYFGLGVGNGLSVSVDVPLNASLTLGASLGTGLFGGAFPTEYDLRVVYDFVRGAAHGLSIAGVVGVWGAPGAAGFTGPFGLSPGLEVGFGLAYPFTPQLTGRLNLMVPYYGLFAGPYYMGFGGPSGGLELGYRFRRYLEATLGSNGHGNLLGLKMDF